MDASKFHFYSFGIVAANKKRGSDLVEVFPQERFTMSAGEISDNVEKIKVKGKDAGGKDYQGELESKPSITCKWLPIGEPNRVTPPDVRRQEQVIIYRYADSDYYFWSSAFNNIIRKLETAAWWFSGTPEDGEGADTERTAENGYFLEVSSHDKHVIFSTSKKNGEKVRYYFQFDMEAGNFILKDDLGQSVVWDSLAGIMEVTSENEIIHNTKKYTINCDEYILNCKTSVVNASESAKYDTPEITMTQKLQVKGQSLFIGLANFTTGIGGGTYGNMSAALSFKGNVDQVGTWRTTGAFGITGNFTVTGTGNFSGHLSAPNVP